MVIIRKIFLEIDFSDVEFEVFFNFIDDDYEIVSIKIDDAYANALLRSEHVVDSIISRLKEIRDEEKKNSYAECIDVITSRYGIYCHAGTGSHE